MGLTTWADAPEGKIRPSDVVIAKNYLSEFEKYRVVQDHLYMSDYDRFILELEGEKDDSEEETKRYMSFRAQSNRSNT